MNDTRSVRVLTWLAEVIRNHPRLTLWIVLTLAVLPSLFYNFRLIDQGWHAVKAAEVLRHPEVAFWRLNGETAMRLPKKIKGRVNAAGMDERRALLASHGLSRDFLDASPPRGAAEDDFLDAAAVMLVAARHARGEARPFPDPPDRDDFGLPHALLVIGFLVDTVARLG